MKKDFFDKVSLLKNLLGKAQEVFREQNFITQEAVGLPCGTMLSWTRGKTSDLGSNRSFVFTRGDGVVCNLGDASTVELVEAAANLPELWAACVEEDEALAADLDCNLGVLTKWLESDE